jgi:hypothetical protein
MNRKQEITIEINIAMKVVDALLASGYALDVYNGEENTVTESINRDVIKRGLFTTDEDRLFVYKDNKRIGWVFLVWGNVQEVISDYTLSVEHVMNKIIDDISEGRLT